MQIKKITKPKKLTYLDRECEVVVYHFDSKSDGNRVCAFRWADNSNLEITHIKGDGRTKQFQRFAQVIIPNGTQADVDAFINNI